MSIDAFPAGGPRCASPAVCDARWRAREDHSLCAPQRRTLRAFLYKRARSTSSGI